MALLLARHGSTAANAGDPQDPTDLFRGSGMDIPMSPFGLKTAQETAKWLQGVPIHQIVSSPMLRAQQIAQLASQATGAPITVDERLRPWHLGVLTGRQITLENMRMLEYYRDKAPTEAIPNGEPAQAYIDRSKSILPELAQAAQSQNVLVAGHHRTAMMFESLLYNRQIETKGHPLPGGVVVFGPKGKQELFTPPQIEQKEGKSAEGTRS